VWIQENFDTRGLSVAKNLLTMCFL